MYVFITRTLISCDWLHLFHRAQVRYNTEELFPNTMKVKLKIHLWYDTIIVITKILGPISCAKKVRLLHDNTEDICKETVLYEKTKKGGAARGSPSFALTRRRSNVGEAETERPYLSGWARIQANIWRFLDFLNPARTPSFIHHISHLIQRSVFWVKCRPEGE